MTNVTINSRLAEFHLGRDLSEPQPVAKTEIDYLSRPRRQFRIYQPADMFDCIFILPVIAVVIIDFEKITLFDTLMDLTIADVVKTAVAHGLDQIASRQNKVCRIVE